MSFNSGKKRAEDKTAAEAKAAADYEAAEQAFATVDAPSPPLQAPMAVVETAPGPQAPASAIARTISLRRVSSNKGGPSNEMQAAVVEVVEEQQEEEPPSRSLLPPFAKTASAEILAAAVPISGAEIAAARAKLKTRTSSVVVEALAEASAVTEAAAAERAVEEAAAAERAAEEAATAAAAAREEAEATRLRMQQEAEAAAEAARLAAMSEEDLTNMQLGARLGAERSTCRVTLSATEDALGATEAALGSTRDATRLRRADDERHIRRLQEQIEAYETMINTIRPYDEQCEALKGEVVALASMEDQRRSDTQCISGRVQRELAEAEGRLGKQNDLLVKLQKEVAKKAAEASEVEQGLEAELARASSESAAAALTCELSKAHLHRVCAEQAKLMELGNEEPRLAQAKRDRAATTRAQVDDLKEFLLEDEQAIAACKRREAAIEEAESLAEAAAQARSRAYEVDRHCVTCIAALQDSALASDLAAPTPTLAELASGATPGAPASASEGRPGTASEGRPGTLPYPLLGTPNPSSEPTLNSLHRLKYESRTLLLTHRELTQATAAQRAQAEADDQAKEQVLREARAVELKQVRAQRKAREVAFLERQRYLSEKQSQLEVEQRQVILAMLELQDREACVKVLQREVEVAQAALSARQGEAAAALKQRQDLSAKLETAKRGHKSALVQLRNRADSERRVQLEQATYVDSLRSRLKVEGQMIAEEWAMEQGGALAVRGGALALQGGALQGAAVDGGKGTAPDALRATPGKAGLALVHRCSMAEWLEGLQATKAQLEARCEAARTGLEIAISKARLEDRRLEEQRVNQLHELTTLRDYEHKIASKLLHLPAELREPDAAGAASSPNRSTRSPHLRETVQQDRLAASSPGGLAAGSLAMAHAASDVLASRSPSGESTWGDVVHSTARAASPTVATPYRRSFLDLEKFASTTSPAGADGVLADEASHSPRLPQAASDDDDGMSTLQALRRRVSSAILG